MLWAAHRAGKPGLIAEVKKASPSKGVIQPDFDPVRIAKAYEAGGAACLSVLTDEKFFQGSFANLTLIRDAGVACPLLCKEFIVEAYQVYKARASGADAILLIAAVLPNRDLAYFLKVAGGLGMQCLIEVHTERELARVLELPGVEGHLLGINNRDLGTFKVDLGLTATLMGSVAGQQVRAGQGTHPRAAELHAARACAPGRSACHSAGTSLFSTALYTHVATGMQHVHIMRLPTSQPGATCCKAHTCCKRSDPLQVKQRGIMMTGESGIFTPEDVAFVQAVGGGGWHAAGVAQYVLGSMT